MTDPLAQLLAIWIGVFIAVYAAKVTKLTPVLFYLAVGAVAVNTGILPHEAHPFIRGFAEIGIIVIMFALGFEESPVNFLRSVKRSWGIAFFGALAPFAVAYSVADYFWGDTNMSMMFGLAMTATAVSLTMVSLKGEGLARSAAATGIMTSAVLDDIASLALVAVLVSVATDGGSVSLADIAWIIAKVFLFFALITFVGAWVFPHERPKFLRRLPFLEQLAIRRLFRAGGAEMTTLAVLTLALAAGIASQEFGFHPAIGAYMAGLILREEYFDMPSARDINQFKNTKRIVDSVAFTWIGPVFFVQPEHVSIKWNQFDGWRSLAGQAHGAARYRCIGQAVQRTRAVTASHRKQGSFVRWQRYAPWPMRRIALRNLPCHRTNKSLSNGSI